MYLPRRIRNKNVKKVGPLIVVRFTGGHLTQENANLLREQALKAVQRGVIVTNQDFEVYRV